MRNSLCLLRRQPTPANFNSFSELKIDVGRANVVPTIKVEDHDETKHRPGSEDSFRSALDGPEDAAVDEMPGSMPTSPASAIPDWYRVGWRQNSSIDNAALTGVEERSRNVLEMFLNEQFYGEWYHNAAVIVVVR